MFLGMIGILACAIMTSFNLLSSATSFSTSPVSNNRIGQLQDVSNSDFCPVALDDLRLLEIPYIDFSGAAQTGEMIVHEAIADDVAEIFQELYEAQYPIERIELVEEYDCDDERSMEANNTSCYNYRPIEGSSRISKHGYGLAIDVNPLYNPYVKDTDEGRVVP